MLTLARYGIGFLLILLQVFIGARAFFPEIFENDEHTLDELLESKQSIIESLAPEDLAFITQNRLVKVGVDPAFYPLEMFDERGRYTGLGGDYLKLLQKMTGLQFQPVALEDWAATEALGRAGGVDMFMAAARTGRRSEFLSFTAPYISMPGIIMTRRGSGLDKTDINSLAGKKVAVVKDYSWHDFLREFHPEIEAMPVANTLEALQKVAAGEADAVLDYEFNLLEKIQTGGILQIQPAGQVDSAYGHAIAVRNEEPELFNILTTAMSHISPKEKEALAKKWIEREKPAGPEKQLQWVFFFLVEAFLLLLFVNWYYARCAKKEFIRMEKERTAHIHI